jgi:hypothetical protein
MKQTFMQDYDAAIWHLRWQRILVMSRSFDFCSTRAKIQTDTTRWEAIPTRHRCTKLPGEGTMKWSGSLSNGVQDWNR